MSLGTSGYNFKLFYLFSLVSVCPIRIRAQILILFDCNYKLIEIHNFEVWWVGMFSIHGASYFCHIQNVGDYDSPDSIIISE